MAQAEMAPKVHLSHFTDSHGEHVWQVMEKGMPLCPSRPDEDWARMVYDDRYRRGLRWDAGRYQQRSDIPETPPVWNGDRGEFEQ